MDWLSTGWDTVSGFATDAFNWIGENPEAANMLGGIAVGAGQAYLQNEQAKGDRAFQREMYDRQRRDRQVKPGEISNYGSHNATMTKGLLSHGMITGEG
ncbi:hypothetical protein [Litchfieldella xinjiangensis]|uniref:hypothetical protein n=1 Tax=Litchfieldella xinjiangensis TaxID=1166948 RepID=UPI0005BBC498|nr:hypothetical protein [Halomonas xinjiangensis]